MQRAIMEALSRTEEGQMEMGRALIEGQKEIAKIISFFWQNPLDHSNFSCEGGFRKSFIVLTNCL